MLDLTSQKPYLQDAQTLSVFGSRRSRACGLFETIRDMSMSNIWIGYRSCGFSSLRKTFEDG